MRVVFACAGTGGHINPAIAMANLIVKKEKMKVMIVKNIVKRTKKI